MKRYVVPLAIIAGVFIASFVATLLLTNRSTPVAPVTDAGVAGAEPPHVAGSATAPLVIEEFGDFECMPCFVLWPALKNLKKDYGDRLAVMFRQYPLARHARALDAARAAEAAGLQGRFWEMHDLLYLHRSEWLRAPDVQASFADFATQLRLNVERFRSDVGGEAVRERIAADQRRGSSLGVDRTPVLFLNGRRLQLQADVESGLRSALETELGNRPR